MTDRFTAALLLIQIIMPPLAFGMTCLMFICCPHPAKPILVVFAWNHGLRAAWWLWLGPAEAFTGLAASAHNTYDMRIRLLFTIYPPRMVSGPSQRAARTRGPQNLKDAALALHALVVG